MLEAHGVQHGFVLCDGAAIAGQVVAGHEAACARHEYEGVQFA